MSRVFVRVYPNTLELSFSSFVTVRSMFMIFATADDENGHFSHLSRKIELIMEDVGCLSFSFLKKFDLVVTIGQGASVTLRSLFRIALLMLLIVGRLYGHETHDRGYFTIGPKLLLFGGETSNKSMIMSSG